MFWGVDLPRDDVRAVERGRAHGPEPVASRAAEAAREASHRYLADLVVSHLHQLEAKLRLARERERERDDRDDREEKKKNELRDERVFKIASAKTPPRPPRPLLPEEKAP